LTEALVKVNRVPLALFFPIDENPEIEDFFYIYFKMTGTYIFILLPFLLRIIV
jgi:hypothetical protein